MLIEELSYFYSTINHIIILGPMINYLFCSFSERDRRLMDEVDGDLIAKKDCKEPYSLLEPSTLPNLWRIVYWSSQFLTWLILPVMQSFSQAGEFTFTGKLKSSLWDNAIYYSSYLLIALILVIYIALQPGTFDG